MPNGLINSKNKLNYDNLNDRSKHAHQQQYLARYKYLLIPHRLHPRKQCQTLLSHQPKYQVVPHTDVIEIFTIDKNETQIQIHIKHKDKHKHRHGIKAQQQLYMYQFDKSSAFGTLKNQQRRHNKLITPISIPIRQYSMNCFPTAQSNYSIPSALATSTTILPIASGINYQTVTTTYHRNFELSTQYRIQYPACQNSIE